MEWSCWRRRQKAAPITELLLEPPLMVWLPVPARAGQARSRRTKVPDDLSVRQNLRVIAFA